MGQLIILLRVRPFKKESTKEKTVCSARGVGCYVRTEKQNDALLQNPSCGFHDRGISRFVCKNQQHAGTWMKSLGECRNDDDVSTLRIRGGPAFATGMGVWQCRKGCPRIWAVLSAFGHGRTNERTDAVFWWSAGQTHTRTRGCSCCFVELRKRGACPTLRCASGYRIGEDRNARAGDDGPSFFLCVSRTQNAHCSGTQASAVCPVSPAFPLYIVHLFSSPPPQVHTAGR